MSKSTPNPLPHGRKASAQLGIFIVVAGVVLVAAMWIGWDLWSRHHEVLVCGGVQRYAIDTRQFDTQYFAYTVKLEAKVKDQATVALSSDPKQQVKLSEAILSANEFRKYVVAGFNSCAISEVQYAEYGKRFQALDSLARQIDEFAGKATLSPEERASLATLIKNYSEVASSLGAN